MSLRSKRKRAKLRSVWWHSYAQGFANPWAEHRTNSPDLPKPEPPPAPPVYRRNLSRRERRRLWATDNANRPDGMRRLAWAPWVKAQAPTNPFGNRLKRRTLASPRTKDKQL